jgi:hypothetical protein
MCPVLLKQHRHFRLKVAKKYISSDLAKQSSIHYDVQAKKIIDS